MRIGHVNTYSPKFGIISEWKKEQIRATAAAAQEEYIRKRSYSSNPKSYGSTTTSLYNSKPQHPEFWSPDYQECLEACRKYANSLKRPDPCSEDYYDQLEDWNEYSRYRTKR